MEEQEIRRRLRDSFLKYVEMHTAAGSKGESGAADKAHKQLHKLYAEVKQKNMTDIFQEFITSEDQPVRLWSAVFY